MIIDTCSDAGGRDVGRNAGTAGSAERDLQSANSCHAGALASSIATCQVRNAFTPRLVIALPSRSFQEHGCVHAEHYVAEFLK